MKIELSRLRSQFLVGGLTKTIDDSTRLCTYLLGGLKKADIPAPLGMFQHTLPEREDRRKLVIVLPASHCHGIVPELLAWAGTYEFEEQTPTPGHEHWLLDAQGLGLFTQLGRIVVLLSSGLHVGMK